MNTGKIFLEVGNDQIQKHGNCVCGDIFLSRKIKEEQRAVTVLSDGLGSGVKANILASMTSSMALNFTLLNEPAERIADIIINTLPIDKQRKIGFASFTVVDVDSEGNTNILEFGNPEFILIRDNKRLKLQRKKISFAGNAKINQRLFHSSFQAQKEDRILFFSDGVTQSGIGRKDMPFGWGGDVEVYVKNMIANVSDISAKDMAKRLVCRAIQNDISKPQDDITAAVMYFRKPRKMLICTGPPYNEERDKMLSEKIRDFDGVKMVCGGTTAMILSRELNRPIEVDIFSGKMGLPPVSNIEGIDLVSEGILTVGRVASILENYNSSDVLEDSTAGDIIKQFFLHDEIEFVVGTRVNEAHQDPTLPVELEIRRNVIKKIASVLEEKLLKKVKIQFV
ncbi:MAG: SpoIIE family protein phosphatase [Bacteroidota bacterium]|nr:SpoIIE family protein phosphatase [Bacteroidota bacterium]